MRVMFIALTAILLLVGASGCGAPTATPAPGTPQPAVATPSPTPKGAAQQPTIVPTAGITATIGGLTLSWWTPEFISPKSPLPTGALMRKILADFEAAQDGNVHIDPVPKARYGKGGLLDYLRAAQPVAPGLLPDIITLDIAELETAVGLGLLRPLDGLLNADIVNGLYPFARQAGQFGNQFVAVPFVADLEHAIYDRNRVNAVPETWTGVLANKIAYAFAAGSPQALSETSPAEDVQAGFIGYYLSAGGALDSKTRRLTVQEQPLQRVLTFYADARQSGVLPANATQMSGPDDSWNAFVQGSVAMANVSARRYLAGRESMPDTGYAPIPGWSGAAPPVATGWALAIVTADPARQKAAVAFIEWLMAPERAGSWSQAGGWLPTQPQAMAAWGANSYYAFLNQELAAATCHPIGQDYVQIAARLQQAIGAVLDGTSKPAEATQAVLSSK